MKCLKTHKPQDDPVYLFMAKKESEGKAPKVAKIAALNKFFNNIFCKSERSVWYIKYKFIKKTKHYNLLSLFFAFKIKLILCIKTC